MKSIFIVSINVIINKIKFPIVYIIDVITILVNIIYGIMGSLGGSSIDIIPYINITLNIPIYV